MIACDYSGSLSVKSRWRRFFSLAMFTFGLCRFSKLVSFLRSIVLVNRGFHLVSRSLNQFRSVVEPVETLVGQSWLFVIWRFGPSCFLSIAKD